MNIGLKITQRCNFKCGHCMFNCGNHTGEDMSSETISIISDFIYDNKDEVQEIHIYGGEPFLNIKHLKNCMDSLLVSEKRIFIATNGSFLMRRDRMEYVYRLLSDHPGEDGVSIGISCTSFHESQYSQTMRRDVQKLKSCFQDAKSFSVLFRSIAQEIDPLCMELEGFIQNPFYGNDNIHFREEQSKMDQMSMNPCGRALKNGYYQRDEKLHCFLSKDSLGFNDIEFDEKGNIGVCCMCKSAVIGNIREFNSLKEIVLAANNFRFRFQKHYKSLKYMHEACVVCKSIKLKKGKGRC